MLNVKNKLQYFFVPVLFSIKIVECLNREIGFFFFYTIHVFLSQKHVFQHAITFLPEILPVSQTVFAAARKIKTVCFVFAFYFLLVSDIDMATQQKSN
jgi:hypothetical protein